MTPSLDPFLFNPHTDTAGKTSLRKAKSHGALLSTVSSLARRPAESLSWFSSRPRANVLAEDQELEHKRIVLLHKLQSADSYEQWRDAASELDKLEGNNDWKHELETDEYDYKLVQARLKDLEDARISQDPKRMLFLVRTALTRHLGGMGDTKLYRHSRVGTKVLIERYIESALETVASLIEVTRRPASAGLGLDARHLMEQILAARQAFGRSALLLSGGGTFGMNHIGVVKALFNAHFLPRIISGASAGSIVASVLCTRTDDEIPDVIDEFCYGDLAVFTKDSTEETLVSQFVRLMKHGSLFDVSNLQRVMRGLLGDMTFQEAYNRTRRILNICVSSAGVYELPRLLNYITAPNVIIWSAVQSSCSVPFVFTAAPLQAKDPKTGRAFDWNPMTNAWIDGSVDNDLPMTRLAELFNVNHFIVSQVNPHVVPFLDRGEDAKAQAGETAENVQRAGHGWLYTLADVARGEAMHRMQVLTELGVFPTLLTKTMSILSQRYSGDITIFPEVPYSQFPKVLKNPTTDFMIEAATAGQRATWPKLCRVQNHCAIELALDDAVQQLRARIAFSPSQVDLRLHTIEQPQVQVKPTLQKSASSLRQNRRRMQSSKSFHSIDTNILGQTNTQKEAKSAAPAASRRSLHDSLKLSSPEIRPVSEEEKMFSTTPNDSSTDDGDDEDEDETETEPDQDYFSVPFHPSRDTTPTLWPSTRQLFPHASQPSTPMPRSKSAGASSRPSAVNAAFAMTPTTGRPALSMTTSDAPTTSFDPSTSASAGLTARSNPPRPPTPHAPHAPLEFDMSGTRGLVLRKRRSMSSGLKGMFNAS